MKIYRPVDNDCRIHLEDLEPVIEADNPYFYNHTWDYHKKLETAWITPERRVKIDQFGCIRHTVKIEYAIDASIAKTDNPAFYARELFMLLNKLYYRDSEYAAYRSSLQESLIEQISANGVGKQMRFAVYEINVSCLFTVEEGDAKIYLELVRHVHREEIVMPGVKEYKDDGYKKPR